MSTAELMIPPLPELTIKIPLKGELRPYQSTGVAYTIEKKCVINGDDMGLGKTLQAIASVIALKSFPCLVICPSVVKENWRRAFEQFSNVKAIVLDDSVKYNFMEYHRVGWAQVFIVNYESLKKFFIQSIRTPKPGERFKVEDIVLKQQIVDFFEAVIVDEIHRLKDFKIQAYKFTRKITMGKEVVIGLTGTAVVNCPMDLASQLAVINRLHEFGGYKEFKRLFCSGKNKASNLKHLNYYLNMICYFRRNKTDPEIKKYLPDKSRQIIQCDLSKEARIEYDHAFGDLKSYMRTYKEADDEQIKKSMKGAVMVRIGILKNISARGKLQDAFEFIEDITSQGHKIIVFCNLHDVIARVQDRFPNSVRITGLDNYKQKQAAIDRFKNDENVNVIVCSIKAAGTGVDGLQDASWNVCFIEFGWHAAVMDQAEDRCYRSGQHRNVMVTYFLGKNTIDEWNYELIEKKRNIANAITGAEDETEVSWVDDVVSLFN